MVCSLYEQIRELTRWLVRKLSTCLSQNAAQMSLQMNLIASNVSENNGLSRHRLYGHEYQELDVDNATHRSVKLAPTCNPMASRRVRTASSSSSMGCVDDFPVALPVRELRLVTDSRADSLADSRFKGNAEGFGADGGIRPASAISCSILLARAVATAELARRVLTSSIKK